MIPGQPPAQPQAQPFPASPPPQGNAPPPVTIDAVVKLLRDDRMRGFRIDIETDSMVEADQQRERKDANEFVAAIGGFFKEFGPIVQAMPPIAPLAAGLLQFAVRRYKVGAELEEMIEKVMGDVQQHLSNPPPPQPSPDEQIKLETAKVKGQAEIQKSQDAMQQTQIDGQIKQQAAQADLAGKVMDHQATVAEHQMTAEEMAREAALAERAHELELDKMKHQAEMAKKKTPKDKA